MKSIATIRNSDSSRWNASEILAMLASGGNRRLVQTGKFWQLHKEISPSNWNGPSLHASAAKSAAKQLVRSRPEGASETSQTFFKGTSGDCVTRAIAIAADLPYREVYQSLGAISKKDPKMGYSSPRDGFHTKRPVFKRYMESLGFRWTPTMRVGAGCTVHLDASELPLGRLVVVSKHYAAVIDGVLHDNHDCSRNGTRCVYGYWSLPHGNHYAEHDTLVRNIWESKHTPGVLGLYP